MTDEHHRDYRNALGCFATGVTIVTCQPKTGEPVGITVNSFASVSLEPPLVSWCLAKESRVYEILSTSENYAVNVLRSTQEELSCRFATPGNHGMGGIASEKGKTGAPLIKDCLANLDCNIEQCVDVGDHVVLIGRVADFRISADGAPLLYYRSNYYPGPEVKS